MAEPKWRKPALEKPPVPGISLLQFSEKKSVVVVRKDLNIFDLIEIVIIFDTEDYPVRVSLQSGAGIT